MYINPDWRWVVGVEDVLSKDDFLNLVQYELKHISSFCLNCLPNLHSGWTILIQSNSKIQKWIAARLNLSQTRYKTIKFDEGELEMFLDELDSMMGLLYGKQ